MQHAWAGLASSSQGGGRSCSSKSQILWSTCSHGRRPRQGVEHGQIWCRRRGERRSATPRTWRIASPGRSRGQCPPRCHGPVTPPAPSKPQPPPLDAASWAQAASLQKWASSPEEPRRAPPSRPCRP
eukprot:scaffold53_cov362-Prasinococcus_capsulatus_cf.AAC.11